MFICVYVYVYTYDYSICICMCICICKHIVLYTENGNFCLHAAKRNTETANFRLFAANGNRKRKFVFPGRHTINDNRSLLFQQACLSMDLSLESILYKRMTVQLHNTL
jgi:hypothetical protein